MAEKVLTNIAASVLQRLNNLARERGEEHNLLLARFAAERLLYRLSISSYATGFILKGAQLFALWSGALYRPTRDIDFLGEGDPAVSTVESIFRAVASLPCDPNDGIVFDPESIRGEEIREEARYAGVRVRVGYHIARARGQVQVDIGYGDVITPHPVEINYPTLLEFPAPQLKVYPMESVIAEKFEAMVTLGILNSRMKDFFDVWMLATHFPFDGALLCQAIRATFLRRGTILSTDIPLALQSAFAADSTKMIQWQAFLRKIATADKLAFTEVIEMLRQFLMPVVVSVASDRPFQRVWSPSTGWAER